MYYTYMHFHCVLSRQKNNVLYNLTSLLSGSVIVGLDLPQQKVYLHIYKLVTTNQGLIQELGANLAPHPPSKVVSAPPPFNVRLVERFFGFPLYCNSSSTSKHKFRG